MSKKDRLIPVITLCICFDKTNWDGPRSLYEMFGKVDPRIKQYVDDYKLNLITPGEIKKLRASGMPADQILQKIEQIVNRNARTRKKA